MASILGALFESMSSSSSSSSSPSASSKAEAAKVEAAKAKAEAKARTAAHEAAKTKKDAEHEASVAAEATARVKYEDFVARFGLEKALEYGLEYVPAPTASSPASSSSLRRPPLASPVSPEESSLLSKPKRKRHELYPTYFLQGKKMENLLVGGSPVQGRLLDLWSNAFLSDSPLFEKNRIVGPKEFILGANNRSDRKREIKNRTMETAEVSLRDVHDDAMIHVYEAKWLESLGGDPSQQEEHIDVHKSPPGAPPLQVEVSAQGPDPSFLWVYLDGPKRDPKKVLLEPGECITFCATTFWHAGYTPDFDAGGVNGPRLYVLYSEGHVVDEDMHKKVIEAAKTLHVDDENEE